MGYNYSERQSLVASFYEVKDLETISKMRKENIAYIVVPAKPIVDFNYDVNLIYLDKHLQKAYENGNVIVFKL